jgi:hypothetical protein
LAIIADHYFIFAILFMQLRGKSDFTSGRGPDKMSDKLITIEEQGGPFQAVFQRIMRMVPDRDKDDKNLQRLLAFRLRIDGEAALSEYLIRKIRETIRCAYTGSLYNFLKDDLIEKECGPEEEESAPDPPGAA